MQSQRNHLVPPVLLFSLIFLCGARPARPEPPSTSPSTSIPADPAAIPQPALQEAYKNELGALYSPQIADRLHQAHLLVEKYFAAPAKERKAIVQQIEALQLDPNLVGRITRIRLYWPALKGGVYYINERVGPHPVIYFLGVPHAYDRTRPWPLVIKLPGAHAFITDPPPGPDDVLQIYTDWIKEELAKHPDAVLLMPMLNLNELWGPSYAGMNSVIQPMHHVAGRLNIDPRRVYLLGHGMSAHATWNLALHHPTYFAAINPMAGGASAEWQRLRTMNLRNVFTVAWHDADDALIKPEASRSVVKLLRQYKYDVDYQETNGVGHAPSEPLVEQMYQKMRSRARELYPKELVLGSNRPDSLFNRSDWLQVYQPLTPGPERRAPLRHGSGVLTTHQNPYSITATFTQPNRIDISAKNVQSIRIHLNDQLANLKDAVTVAFNGRVRFEDPVTISLEEMLLDQLYLGRGWRYYTAFLDIDFGAPRTQTSPASVPPHGKN